MPQRGLKRRPDLRSGRSAWFLTGATRQISSNGKASGGIGTGTIARGGENGLATETRFTERASLGAGVNVGSAAGYSVSNIDTGNSHTYGPPVTRSLNLAFNYHVVPNRVVVALAYAYDNNTDATNTFAKTTSDTAVKDRSGNTVGVRLMYAFR